MARNEIDPKVPAPATIKDKPTKANGWRYRVETDDGREFSMAGMGAPMGGEVGDRGTVVYQSGASFGLYFWAAEMMS